MTSFFLCGTSNRWRHQTISSLVFLYAWIFWLCKNIRSLTLFIYENLSTISYHLCTFFYGLRETTLSISPSGKKDCSRRLTLIIWLREVTTWVNSAIDYITFFARSWEDTRRKACKSLVSGSWFTSSSCLLPASKVRLLHRWTHRKCRLFLL